MHILIATRNRHKVEEIRAILGPERQFSTLADFPAAPVAVEDQGTFEGNATKKAVTLASWLAGRSGGIDFVLADDSGLEVDALNGAPGVHSARFAGLDRGEEENTPDHLNNAKLLRLLAGIPPEKRTGRFRCVIAFTPVPGAAVELASPSCALNEAEFGTLLFSGACEGRVLERAQGGKGFGYDPLFVPRGFDRSFAELGEAVKNKISHRSQALDKLKAFLTHRAE
jgi:XTP/dITP diphosphohydrolase